ncbi:helix-turn-helix transcriptional regulator [Sulfurimonas sp.]|uniref:helix-turn-helix domain-containing protein n=1 Tax=Sulfurimonas sp. TaxID=2022749 RepID=UPI002B47EFCD|nr:helix-turn-helix transcriptional regulator [Sulfurimonas sp.]
MNINSNILNIRKELRLNQTDFAKKLNSTQGQISSYEKGQVEPPLKIIINMNKIFNVNINWLITGKGEIFIQDCNGINVNHCSNVAINGFIKVNTNDYADSEEIQELLELLKEVPKSWIDKILIKLKKQLQAFDEEF